MSIYTGVSNFQKTVRFFWPTLYIKPKIGPLFLPALYEVLLFVSLPGFAHGDQQTELNQTSPNGKSR